MPEDLICQTELEAPRYATWELTHRCNASCLHCYCSAGPDVGSAGELPLTAALDVIDQLADAGVRVLALSGGEALLYRHWYEVAGHAVKRGLCVNVASNGSCINAANAHLLMVLGVTSVSISLDSHLGPVHDHFRQRRGIFERACAAIELLAGMGMRVVVDFTPTRLNWRDGAQVIALAHRLGAHAVSLADYVAAGRGAPALALSSGEQCQVLQEWTRAKAAYRGRIELMWHDGRASLLLAPAQRAGCGDARMGVRILPDASMMGGLVPAGPVGNIVTDGFAALWQRLQLREQDCAPAGAPARRVAGRAAPVAMLRAEGLPA